MLARACEDSVRHCWDECWGVCQRASTPKALIFFRKIKFSVENRAFSPLGFPTIKCETLYREDASQISPVASFPVPHAGGRAGGRALRSRWSYRPDGPDGGRWWPMVADGPDGGRWSRWWPRSADGGRGPPMVAEVRRWSRWWPMVPMVPMVAGVVSVCPIIFPIIGEHVSTRAYRFSILHVSK
jgi:hypothetical protein